jgi:hypothetical protein
MLNELKVIRGHILIDKKRNPSRINLITVERKKQLDACLVTQMLWKPGMKPAMDNGNS